MNTSFPGGSDGKAQTTLDSCSVLEFECWGFSIGSAVKNPPAKAGDVGLIPGLRRYPGEGNGNPLQYSNPQLEEPNLQEPEKKAGSNWACNADLSFSTLKSTQLFRVAQDKEHIPTTPYVSNYWEHVSARGGASTDRSMTGRVGTQISPPRDRTCASCIAGRFFMLSHQGNPKP